MNYKAHYDLLIAKRGKTEKPEGYSERHHIVPKSLGGSDEASNLVYLTAKEHFVAHMLLAKYAGHKMVSAFAFMCSKNTNSAHEIIVTARTYDLAKKNMGISKSITNLGKGNPFYGKTHSPETLEKLRLANVGKHTGEKNVMFGKTHSEEARLKISKGVVIATNLETGEEFEILGSIGMKSHGFTQSNVSRVIHGVRKKHQGHSFRYA